MTIQRSLPAALAAMFLAVQAPRAAEPRLEKTDLFEIGQEGYLSYRIPAIVVSPRGTVLAFTGARKKVSDWAETQILIRRSPDGGKTWEPRRAIAAEEKQTVDCPVPIVDRQTGSVHFLYQVNYARCYYMRSDDEGRSFTRPVDITKTFEAFRPEYDWTVITPSPGTAIQLASGRLVVPVWLSNGGGHAHRPSCTSVIYSDDHGATWRRGEIAVRTTEATPNPSESAAVELSDGRVMLNVRCESPRYRRLVTVSPDGATHWLQAQVHEELYDPICHASLIRLPSKDGKSRLLFVNPDSRTKTNAIRAWGGRPRENVTLKLSCDEGRSWPVSKVLEPERSAYTSLACGPDGTIYCLYERGYSADNELNTRYLTVARFNLEWLTDGKDSLGLAAAASESRGLFETTTVWPAQPKNRPNYRIPAVIAAPNGDMLVFAEKRNDGPGDLGNHDLVMKRSRDCGKTWSPEIVLYDDGPNASTDPTPAQSMHLPRRATAAGGFVESVAHRA